MPSRIPMGWIGSHPLVVWAVKHIMSPLDQTIVRVSHGRIPPLSSFALPTLLLTTVGRRSGQDRTVPLVYVREGGAFVVANARPASDETRGFSTCAPVATVASRYAALASR